MRRAGMGKLTSGLALLLVLGAAGCATTGSRNAPPRPALTDVEGVFTLSDGTPVVGARLVALCDGVPVEARTDDRGHFRLAGVPEGRCEVSCPDAAARTTLSAGPRLLTPMRRWVLPPVRRVTLGLGGRQALLDESLAHPVTIGGVRLELKDGKILVDGRARAELSRVAPGTSLGKVGRGGGAALVVKAITARPWVPVGLRTAPRGDEVPALTVATSEGRLTAIGRVLGTRTILLVERCDAMGEELRADLAGLGGRYAAIGLRALAVAVEQCSSAARASGLLLGGNELLWALGARAGQVLILDEQGRVLERFGGQKEAPLSRTLAYLDRWWPPFAALRRVSLVHATSVPRAEASRLLVQAERRARVGNLEEAHRILDRILQLAPDHVEAHRQRALTKARLGDLSGALDEVAWWRSTFGDLAADELLDELRRKRATRR